VNERRAHCRDAIAVPRAVHRDDSTDPAHERSV
jgi:hypothetical protein